jgi:hypothetical protein
MSAPQAVQLSEMIRRNTEDFKELCKGVDEDTASRAPADRWSPKQIVSHLCGPEGVGYLPTMRAFVDQDKPRLDLQAENPFYSDNRARMTFAELLAEFDAEYGRIAAFASGLSAEQLTRTAHIPMLKESPLGEHPTLAQWIEAIGAYHLGTHIDHMREILKALGAR